MSEKYTIGSNDFINGAKTALFTSILTVLITITQTPGFDVFDTDWKLVGANVVNVAVITIIGYMSRKFFENEEGKLMG